MLFSEAQTTTSNFLSGKSDRTVQQVFKPQETTTSYLQKKTVTMYLVAGGRGDIEGYAGSTWYCTVRSCCSLVSEFSVPVFSAENAPSVGANTVIPCDPPPLSCELIWSDTCVPFNSFMNVVNCPAFFSTAITSAGPAAAAAAVGDAAGLWAEVGERRNRRNEGKREVFACGGRKNRGGIVAGSG
ncbi:hypothetical protein TIFTF001_047314 [Ficus carica]|uniref:Uncharacterized protein n=1 Tax=Ficus carica TaxID=3494 RepID=A0AA88CL20_FICCA|nr:hypothetical protein TIFTF001_047314 [Ficus carica]